ncbi:MAG: two-component regulator propeller domain-containing protein [Vicinamibacterales bacterium]
MALVLAVLAVLVTADAVAATSVRPLSGYTVSSWSGEDGVTLGAVRAMAQDRDGYLWLGTSSGLFRFDGLHFVPVESLAGGSLPRLPVRALLFQSDGALWIGLGDGGGIHQLAAGQLRESSQPRALPGNINGFARDAAGTIWVAHDNGLLQRTGDRWTPVGAEQGMTADRVLHLHTSGETVVAATSSGLFLRTSTSGRFAHVDGGDEPLRSSLTDRDGNIWVTDSTRGYRQVGVDDRRAPSLAGRGSELLADHRGRLWLGTVGQGLWLIDRANDTLERVTLQAGLMSDGIWSLLEDREGNIWVGTHEGLNRLSRHIVTPLVDLGITSTISRGIAGVMWAASSEGVIRLSPGASPDTPTRKIFPIAGVRTLHADARGKVWVASRDGLSWLSSGRFTAIPSPSGQPFTRVVSITSDRRHAVWFADAARGLWRWTDEELRPYPLPPSSSVSRVRILHSDVEGTVWMAFEDGTLGAVSESGAFATYGRGAGLEHEAIRGFYDDTKTGLWVVGSNGLSHRVGNRFQTLERDQGLPARRVLGLTGDTDGGLWIAFPNGIGQLARSEIARTLADPSTRVHVRVVDTSHGLAGVPTTLDTHTAARADDGRLWFVTGRGLTIIEPRRALAKANSSGRVRVEAALVDGVRVSVGRREPLPAGASRLRIDYTALNLTSPDRLRFRYRLEGFETDWQDAGPRRQAFYTNLRPRDYRFRVQVSDTDGVWQESLAEWSFSVAPVFYQRPGFYLLCTLGLAAALATAWRLRLRQVRREFGLVLAERARLSRELHDTLLQNMVGVALKVDAVAQAPEQARAQLMGVRRDIEDSIAEARRTIRNMRAGVPVMTTGDLIVALEDAGARATSGSAARCRLVVRGTPYRCSPAVEGELLRIAQEALGNAVRHGQPTEVTIALSFERSVIALRITDNGRGFLETTVPSGHFGLVTMRERAEHLGGHFRLTTSQRGTEVEATIPATSLS